MENPQIEELMEAMKRQQVRRLVVKKEGFELEIERESEYTGGSAKQVAKFEASDHISETVALADLALQHASVHSGAIKKADNAGALFITSPMVGTFYASPSPEDPVFIKVGDRVEKGAVVCIIEAMKVMNEIKSEAAGTVAEILVDNGHPVEFGTKLYRLTQ